MAGIRQRGTQPEIVVAKALRALGIRYRTSNRDLPGSPDLVNRKEKWAIFVHGCYWHRHSGCAASTTPSRNRAIWEEKFRQNVERDRAKANELRKRGFRVITIWECTTKKPDRLARQLVRNFCHSQKDQQI